MATTDDQWDSSTDDDLETQRSTIRQSLDQIANDVGIAMRDAHLHFPLGLTVPASWHAIVTIVTPVHPSDDDWSHTTAIAHQIVSKRLGGIGLCSRPLPCAIAKMTMSVAEITPNVLTFDTRS